jgi:Domain of unknown function (DUF4124)
MLALAPMPALAEICKYIDRDGNMHYTNVGPEQGWRRLSCGIGQIEKDEITSMAPVRAAIALAPKEEWKQIGGTAEYEIYVWPSSIKKSLAGKANAWFLYNYHERQEGPKKTSYQKIKARYAADCVKLQFAELEKIYFGGGSTAPPIAWEDGTNFQEPDAASVGEWIVRTACNIRSKAK